MPNAIVVLLFNTRTSGSRLTSKRKSGSFTFQLQCKPVSSAFQHKCEHVSSVSQHQSEVHVQRETRVSAVTDSHEIDQLHPIFSPHNGKLLSIMERFKGLVTPLLLWRDLRIGYTPEFSINSNEELGEFWRRNPRSHRPEEENLQKGTLDA